jgi:hypothetical protein
VNIAVPHPSKTLKSPSLFLGFIPFGRTRDVSGQLRERRCSRRWH